MQENRSVNDSSSDSLENVVKATPKGLIKSTLGAALVASAILTFIWLPAEYGIDPTGVGRLLGLTEMGQIKGQLQVEAGADEETAKVISVPLSGVGGLDISSKLDSIQEQLNVISATLEANSTTVNTQVKTEKLIKPQTEEVTEVTPSVWRDEVSYILAKGEGIEVKLKMEKGAVAEFEWSANGAVLNYDTHGNGAGQKISYEKGRSIPKQTGKLTAAFKGNHGWFWRNRTDAPVTVTLRARGEYAETVLP